MKYHLLFEQSGTFKNVLKKHGHEAYDYDILDDFGETDYKIDLFDSIECAWYDYESIFDSMGKDDFIIAFFPCTHFSGLNQFQYKLLIGGKKRELDSKAILRLIKRNKERSKYFELYMKLCYICKIKGIKLIVENPASCSGNHSFLELFSPIDIAYKETNR